MKEDEVEMDGAFVCGKEVCCDVLEDGDAANVGRQSSWLSSVMAITDLRLPLKESGGEVGAPFRAVMLDFRGRDLSMPSSDVVD